MIVGDYKVLRGFGDELGRGASGVVSKAEHLRTGDIVAVKSVKLNEKTEEGREHARKYIMTEVELLRTLHHDNIVQLFKSTKQDGFLFIFLELCNKGDLAEFVLARHSLSARMTVSFLRDISRALHCLHTHNPVIVHRDVKPENILVSATSKEDLSHKLKLTDFAFSRRAPPGSDVFSASSLGTIKWMAPEIRPGQDGHVRYNEKADVFSAGLVFLSLIEHVSGTALRALTVDGLSVGEWMNRQQILGNKVTTLSITKASDDALQTLVKGVVIQMINPDHKYRCSMEQVCNTIDLAYAIPSLAGTVAPSRSEGPSASIAEEGATSTSTTEGAMARSTTEGAMARSTTEGASASSETLVPMREQEGNKRHKSRGFFHKMLGKFQGLSMESRTVTPTKGSQPARGSRAKGEARTEGREEGRVLGGEEGARAQSTRADKGAEAGHIAAAVSSAELRVSKLNHIALTSKEDANLHFGPANFIVGYTNDPDYYFYDYTSSKYNLVWKKKIPEGLLYNSYKQLSANNNIFIQLASDKVCQFNEKLSLIRKLQSPGVMRGLLPGGHDAVVDNYATSSTATGLTLAVAPVTNLLVAHHHLDTPDAGPYKREEMLHACGRQDGQVAVISIEKPFVDIYSDTGRHMCRTPLPHGAGRPGCSDTHLLVPLWDKPRIAVLSWEGELLHILGPDQLELHEDDRGFSVSPVHEGRVSFFVAPDSGGYQVNTYKIL